MLRDKVAVIYGGGGAVGGAVAEAFGRHGAHVVLAGRTAARLERVACRIWDKGGHAEAMPVDALDADAVERHMAAIVERFGRVDISFNLIDVADIQGPMLAEMPEADFLQPIDRAMRTHFLTATAAARRMMQRKSGVILALSAQCGRQASPTTGGFGVACAAIEALHRQLAAELGPFRSLRRAGGQGRHSARRARRPLRRLDHARPAAASRRGRQRRRAARLRLCSLGDGRDLQPDRRATGGLRAARRRPHRLSASYRPACSRASSLPCRSRAASRAGRRRACG